MKFKCCDDTKIYAIADFDRVLSLSLIEKAEANYDQKQAEDLAKRLKQNKFTLQDYYDQLVQMKSMGSMEDILGMMPGMAKKRHPIVEQRTADLTAFAETCDLNREEWGGTDIGIITTGTSYQYVKEVCGDRFPVMGHYVRNRCLFLSCVTAWRNCPSSPRPTCATHPPGVLIGANKGGW